MSGRVAGVVVGLGAGVMLGLGVAYAPKAQATAWTLVPYLTQIYETYQEYMDLFNDFMDEWRAGVGGDTPESSEPGWSREQASVAHDDGTRGHAFWLYEGGERPINYRRDMQERVRETPEDRLVAPDYSPGERPLSDEDELDAVVDWSMVVTEDTVIPPMDWERHGDTLEGIEYESVRNAYIAQQSLAQKAVREYFYASEEIADYQDALEHYNANNVNSWEIGRVAREHLMLDAQAMQLQVSRYQSMLRQERLLGAMLSQQANEVYPDQLSELEASR